MDNDLKIIYGSWIFIVVSLFITIQFIPLTSASLVLGTNCGFVSVAPTNDEGGGLIVDNQIMAIKDTSSATAGKITEIGWWCDTASQESNFEVGIYSHDSGNDKPDAVVGTLSQTNAKGTAAGWKRVTGLNIPISPNTIYWIAFQLDDTATATATGLGFSGARISYLSDETTLSDPWSAGSSQINWINAIYAVWEEVAVDTCTCPGLNQDWEIDMSDYCNITDDCNLGTGTLNFTGAGITRINATIHTTNLGDPGTSGILKILSDCLIWVV